MIVSRLFDVKESLINSAAHLRRIFSRLLPVKKPAVRQVLPVFFAVAYEKSARNPHTSLIIASLCGSFGSGGFGLAFLRCSFGSL